MRRNDPGGSVGTEEVGAPFWRHPGEGGARVARAARPAGTRVELRGPLGAVAVGGPFVVVAGPCAVEGAGPLKEAARAVAEAGCAALRGGAFKPRTSPYAFQGLGEQGLRLLVQTA